MKLICKICSNIFFVRPSFKQKYCSRFCFGISRRGKHWSSEAKINQSSMAKNKGFGKWMTGKHHSLETRIKISQIGKKRVADGLHNNYKGGIEKTNSAFKHSLAYKQWRLIIIKRNLLSLYCSSL